MRNEIVPNALSYDNLTGDAIEFGDEELSPRRVKVRAETKLTTHVRC